MCRPPLYAFRQRFKGLRAKLFVQPRRFRSHGDHRGHGGRIRQIVEKPLCTQCLRAQFCLSRSSQRTRRGEQTKLQNLCVSAPPCETLCITHAVLDLTEITEDTEGGSDKSLKNLCVLSASVRNSASHGVPKGHEEESRQSFKTSVSPRLRAKLFVQPRRFRSHGDPKGHGGRIRQIVEKPLCTQCLRAKLCLSWSSQRTRRGEQTKL